MQTQGSLRDGGLATLLQSMQAERATGTLTIDNGGDSCSLYFLFGHLFHASGPGGQGEEVVIDALGWDDGSYQFDPRAKLPAEETIKASPAELIAAAESRHAPAAAAATGASIVARHLARVLDVRTPTRPRRQAFPSRSRSPRTRSCHPRPPEAAAGHVQPRAGRAGARADPMPEPIPPGAGYRRTG